MSEKTLKRNGILAALFLYQYSLLIPVMNYFNPTIVSAISGVIIVIILLIGNLRSAISTSLIRLFFIIVFITSVNTLFNSADLLTVFPFYFYLLPVIVVFLFRFDYSHFIRCCCYFAVLNFFILFWMPFTRFANYMRFGYGMLPTIIFTYLLIFRYREEFKLSKIKIFVYAAILFASVFEIVFFGARGSFFAFLLFVVIDRFLVNREKIITNALLILAGVITYLNLVPILGILKEIVSVFGVKAYAISKLSTAINKGIIEASSGRDILYQKAIESIKAHPFMGSGIDVAHGDDYVHNIFLQVAQDLGIWALIPLIIILVKILWILIKKTGIGKDEKAILEVLFAISMGRLMFSSTLWRRPEFWMMICFYYCITRATKKSVHRGEK